MNVSHVLYSWRRDQRLTVEEAARHVGISPDTYRRLETGKSAGKELKPPSWNTVRAIMRWLFEY